MKKFTKRLFWLPWKIWMQSAVLMRLGHLDYVVRYGKCQARQYSYKKYAQEIDEILKKVIAMGRN